MAKHKVKRYDGEDGSEVEDDTSALTAYTPPAAQAKQAPVVTKEQLAKSGLSLRDYMNQQQGLTRRGSSAPAARSDDNYGNEGRGSKAPEARDRFGIPGKVGSPSAPNGNSADSTELGRNLSAAVNATGASSALQGIRRGAAVGKGLAEFAAGRNAAAEVAPVVNARRAAPNPATLEKFNEGLRKAKPAMDREAARQAVLKADTLKTGGKVKGYAKGGSISSASSRADGIAQRGKTRGVMLCSGGMAKGKR
ncbi:hypothetical protein UFOVP48_77 [uncultured Caudovirales phage]|uniref:Uncharacterized protein n=1 Tax=uncultured Caudovirales phage TaxID=2100421 RepID=A0A6J5KU84_9CAUD|nr:hypothetical protein UFOVP48_77 [uncultured Caudovirales phage]